MGKELVASIDAGTTSVRFMVFDAFANVIGSHQLEFTQFYDKPGWQDQDPHEIVDKVNICIEETVKAIEAKGEYTRSDIKVTGVTNQRETTVVWDKNTGKALTRCIAWPDTRTAGTVREFAAKSEKGVDAVKYETGLPLSTYFAATKLRWMLDNLPNVKKAHDEKTMLFGTVDSWLVYNLTKGKAHITDASNASRTMFMDLRKQAWDPKLCEFFGIDKDILPTIKSSAEIYGQVSEGVLAGVDIGGIVGDQMAALVGQKCLSPGEAKNTYGTGAFLLYNTGDKVVDSKNGLLSTIAYQAGPHAQPQYALEGSIAVAGSAIKWLRDNLGLIKEAKEVDCAGEIEASECIFVTAFSGLLAPVWDTTAAGTLIGLSGFHDKRHICRSVLEAACFQTKAVLDAMEKDSGVPLKALQVDGGMTNSDIFCQIQSDILDLNVERPAMRETTALGSALLAGQAKGLFGWDLSRPETLSKVNMAGRDVFESKLEAEKRKELLKQWWRAVERSRGWHADA
ncbi:unnamed protein product [Sympodiomycopsis kandeliae]